MNATRTLTRSVAFRQALGVVGLDAYADRRAVQEADEAEALACALLDLAARDGIPLQCSLQSIPTDPAAPLTFSAEFQEGGGYGDLVAVFTITGSDA